MNQYVAANNTTEDCIKRLLHKGGETLQKAPGSWSKSGRQISRAERELASTNPAG